MRWTWVQSIAKQLGFSRARRLTPGIRKFRTARPTVETLEDRVVPVHGNLYNPFVALPQNASSAVISQEGQTVKDGQQVLTFLDSHGETDGVNLTATIYWADGTETDNITTGSTSTAHIVYTGLSGGQGFAVETLATDAHVYEEVTANDAFTVSVEDNVGSPYGGSITGDAVGFDSGVADAPVTVNPNSGGPLTDINEYDSTPGGTLIGTFTDPGNPSGTLDPTDTYSVDINWGDLSLPDTVTSAGGGVAYDSVNKVFDVYAPAHQYTEGGTYNISLTVTHNVLDPTDPVQTASITVDELAPNITNNGFSVYEGTTHVINSAELSTTTDQGDPANETVYSVTTPPQYGSIQLYSAGSWTDTCTFTQQDIYDNHVQYVNTGGAFGGGGGSGSFEFSVQDDNGAPSTHNTVNITIDEGATTVVKNCHATVTEGSIGNVIGDGSASGGTLTSTADPGDPTSEIVYTITVQPTRGTLFYDVGAEDEGILGNGATFTQADLDAGLITYDNNGALSDNSSDSFGFSVQDDNGRSQRGAFHITVNEATPTASESNSSATVTEGDTNIVIGDGSNGTLIYNADPGDAASEVVYTLTALPVQGTLYLDGTALAPGDSFTQQNINDGLLTYTNDATLPDANPDGFSFSVADDDSTPVADSFTINVTDNAPTVTTNLPATVAEGGTITIGDGIGNDGALSAPNELATEVRYTLTVAPNNGTLYRDGYALGAGDSFTQDDINNHLITYTNDASLGNLPDDTDSFTVTISEPGDDPAGTTFTINITEGTPTASELNTDATVNEGTSGNVIGDGSNGTLVYNADDGDPPSEVIYTVTGTPQQGTLTLTPAVGPAVPLDIGSTFTQDDINNGRITYTNDGSLPDVFPDSFTYTVADDNSTSVADSFNINVNDNAPTFAASSPATVAEGGSTVIGDGNGTDGSNGRLMYNVGDPGDPTSEVIYTLTSKPEFGYLYNTNVDPDLTTPLAIDSTFTQADLDNGYITYVNDALLGTTTPDNTDDFTFSVADPG
jgi:hypothetical protein